MSIKITILLGTLFGVFMTDIHSQDVAKSIKPCPTTPTVGYGSSSVAGANSNESIFNPPIPKIDPNNAPLRLTSKPIVQRTDKTDCSEGTILVKVEFRSDGQIGRVKLVQGLTDSLNADAIIAARKIKFMPTTRQGKAITVFKTVKYNLVIY